MLGRPLSSLRASGMKIGVPNVMWQDLDPEVEAGCRAALEALAEQDGAARGWARGHGARAHRNGRAIDGRGSPSAKPEIVREIEPQLSPLIRALMKYQLLLPADAVVRADRVRADEALARRRVLAGGRRWPGPRRPRPRRRSPTRSSSCHRGATPRTSRTCASGGSETLPASRPPRCPAASPPAGFPIGLQLLAPWREEERLLDLAELLERATDRRFVDAAPPVAQPAAA